MNELVLVALAWAAYGALHSWLASRGVKGWVSQRWPQIAPAYRLLYNLQALVLLALPFWVTQRLPGEPLWVWPGWISWPVAAGVAAAFLWSLRWYDGAAFLGLRQWRSKRDSEGEALAISPLHRYVRHPWYALGLLFIWTRDLNAAWLTAAAVVSLYLVVGSRLEEGRLIGLYGEAYRRYRKRVPGLIPVPGRNLSEKEAEELLKLADG